MDIELKAFASLIPVLKEPGWEFTGANDSNSVRFRNTVYQTPAITIFIGIITYYGRRGKGTLTSYDVLHSWEYCGHCDVPGNRLSVLINIPSPRRKLQKDWQSIQNYYIKHGLKYLA